MPNHRIQPRQQVIGSPQPRRFQRRVALALRRLATRVRAPHGDRRASSARPRIGSRRTSQVRKICRLRAIALELSPLSRQVTSGGRCFGDVGPGIRDALPRIAGVGLVADGSALPHALVKRFGPCCSAQQDQHTDHPDQIPPPGQVCLCVEDNQKWRGPSVPIATGPQLAVGSAGEHGSVSCGNRRGPGCKPASGLYQACSSSALLGPARCAHHRSPSAVVALNRPRQRKRKTLNR